VPAGRVVADEDDAVAAARDLERPAAVKASSAALRHKSDAGALAVGVVGDEAVRAAYRRVAEAGRRAVAGTDAAPGELAASIDIAVLVEAMAEPGVELLVAARRDAVVPALVVGLGGVWTELLDDVAVVPLPATPERVEAALRGLRGFGLLGGARGGEAVDVAALARLAAAVGELLIAEGLTLLELNPVVARADGAVALDALARR
jgi:acetate---CoA ligase (ADP-forming)